MANKRVEVKEDEQLINCLRDERIKVRYIPRQSHMVTDKRHILYGGMARDAVNTFVVPKLQSGTFVNVLTNAEKAFFEDYFGVDLSVYKKVDNFWSDANPQGINKVVLKKEDNYLNLNDPEDYIKYKILLANTDLIAPSIKVLEERPKATYRYVLESENDQLKSAKRSMDVTRDCWIEFGKIEDNKDVLMTIVELIDGRTVSDNTSMDFLHTKIDSYIQENAKRFLKIVKDENLPTKVLIRKSINAGNITKRGDYLYLKSDGRPLCNDNQNPTLDIAVAYINAPKNQDIKLSLEALLNK
jgi:hypothetical protein